MENNLLKEIAGRLKMANKIAIFTHLNPDGDALGSSFGMKYVLESIGKEAVLYVEKEIPEKFFYLGADYQIGDETTKPDCDTALVLDCGDFSRLGTLAKPCESIPVILCVDHHYSGEDFGTVCAKDADAAATAQIAYRLAEILTDSVPQKACEAFYTGISTDTGHFKFSSVTPETHAVAAELLKSGINHRAITQAIYDTAKYGKLIFMGKAAENIEFFADGRIALLRCPVSFLAEYGLTYDDVEELPNLGLKIEGVLVSVLVKDKEADEFAKRVSLRGKEVIDVSYIAQQFGGGGHKNAAAFVLEGNTEEQLRKLTEMITKALGE